jgi:CMP-N-acetylneuraminic acid synthetase
MFRANGAVYVSALGTIRKNGTLVPSGAVALEMSAEDSIDIDNVTDLEQAEAVLRRRQK